MEIQQTHTVGTSFLWKDLEFRLLRIFQVNSKTKKMDVSGAWDYNLLFLSLPPDPPGTLPSKFTRSSFLEAGRPHQSFPHAPGEKPGCDAWQPRWNPRWHHQLHPNMPGILGRYPSDFFYTTHILVRKIAILESCLLTWHLFRDELYVLV